MIKSVAAETTSRCAETNTKLADAEKEMALSGNEYANIVQSEIARSLAVIADELQTIRTHILKT